MMLFHGARFSPAFRQETTAAAVAEFAFVSPILALVMMGMIELSRGIMVKVTLSDAAPRAVAGAFEVRTPMPISSRVARM